MRRLLAFLQALHIDPLEAVLLAMLAATMALLVVDLVLGLQEWGQPLVLRGSAPVVTLVHRARRPPGRRH